MQNTVIHFPLKNMHKNVKVIIGILVGITILAVGWSVLSKKAGEFMMEKVIEETTDGKADVDMDNGTVTITTTEGTVTTGGNRPPEGWPEDVPQYPKSIIQFSGITDVVQGESNMALILRSDDEPDVITAYYKTTLEASGWVTKKTMMANTTSILLMTKEDSALSLAVSKANGATSITIGVQQK